MEFYEDEDAYSDEEEKSIHIGYQNSRAAVLARYMARIHLPLRTPVTQDALANRS